MSDKASTPTNNDRTKRIQGFVLAISVLLFAVIVGVAHTRVMSDMDQQGGRDEARIELNSNGFAPAEIQHAPGIFAIAVDNKTVAEEYTVRLKAEDQTVLYEFVVQKGSSAWTVNLPTGKYVLTEAQNPQWICRIVVQ